MLRLSTEQRRLLADKLCDIANLAAGALIFGQFIGDQRFSVPLALLGSVVWVVGVVLAIALTEE